MIDETVIHIQWEGPFSILELEGLSFPSKDRGLYQIYGHHPVYGSGALLYVGKTGNTFAARVREEGWDGGSMEDPKKIEVYIGRLKGAGTPPLEQWNREIDLAEKLLIGAHGPAYNSTNIMAVCEDDPAVCSTRVLNWGCHPRVEARGFRNAVDKRGHRDSQSILGLPEGRTLRGSTQPSPLAGEGTRGTRAGEGDRR